MRNTPRSWLTLTRGLLVLALLSAALGGGAKQKLIPNTKVPDSKLNREILQVVEKYRISMERLEPAGVLSLVHPTYQDHAGTAEGHDDIDYANLKDLLRTRFKKISKVRYRIEYRRVHFKGRQAEVDAYIDATFVYNEPQANPRWRRLTDFNRFCLLKEGSDWRFISGL
jgi:hypothetical protein